MKAGARAVGIAESYRGSSGPEPSDDTERASDGRSTLAAAVVRGDRVVDGFAFGVCTVGGTDATEAVADLVDRLDREDIRCVLVSGIAPAWFNVLDLPVLEEAIGLPVISISFEESAGLAPALRREFAGEELAARLSTYERQPPRERLVVNGEPVFVRSAGVEPEEAHGIVRAFTPEGGRPEPVRVARLAARAADRLRAD